MNTTDRRARILETLQAATEPLSGTALANLFSVSRQVVVQDIAVLRANGNPIVSVHSGYVLQQDKRPLRVFKVCHTDEQVQEELELIVDFGGRVEDVFVYHKVYGLIRGALRIKSRRDIELYIDGITSGKSTQLKNITSNYHYHTVTADDAATLDMIQAKLKEKGFLAPLTDYEPI